MTQTGVVAGGRLTDWISLGVLASWLPADAVDEAVRATGKKARRRGGKLPPRVTAYLVMALALFADEDYEEVAARLAGTFADWDGWEESWDRTPTSGAITQARQRLGAQPLPSLGDPARRRHLPVLLPAAPPPQGLRQPGGDLLVILIGEQRQRHHQVHHHVRRQLAPGPPRALPRRRHRVIDRIPRHRRRQHPQRDPVRQDTAPSHHTSLRHGRITPAAPGPDPRVLRRQNRTANQDQLRLSGIVFIRRGCGIHVV